MSEEFKFSEDFQKALSTSIAEGIAAAMNPVIEKMNQAQKASTGSMSTWNMVHGRGSFLGQPAVGLEPDVISAMLHWQGLGEHVPIRPSRFYGVFVPFITGVEPTSSTEPTNECDDCIAGETEACVQHFPLARVCRETQTMTPDRVIERLNRGDIDLTLLNDQLGSDSPWHPGDGLAQMNGEQLMQIATAWALLFELPPLFQHSLVPMVWDGNPTNNAAGDGYREFRGMQLLVNTGHVDAFTNTTCPALDSDVKDFAYADMATATAPSLYEMLEMAHYYVWHNAIRQRLTPVQHVIVMRPEPWQILSELVPVQRFMASALRYAAAMGVTVNSDGSAIVNERDRIRNQLMLPLNGQMLQVIIDDGIPELDNANDANLDPGEYASTIYILPIRHLGNRDSIYIEYKDFRFLQGEVAATQGLIGNFYKPSPDGRFAWTWVKDGWCFKVQAKIEPRIVLRVPQLAARIDYVKYVPIQHVRSPDPDSAYFYKGGVSTRTWTSSDYYS
jgi:hypothetical protein